VDVVLLSRLQFAVSTMFHFLFVPFTLGLSFLVAYMETKSRYSAYVGDIFGPLLAIEATAAFFLESILIGVWIFGWKKLSKKAHATVMWLLAIASTLSAVWILIANAWMQNPVGFTIREGRAELVDFSAVLFQKYAVFKFLHTVSAAYVLSAFFVMGVSAYHLLKKKNITFFSRSFRIALVFGTIFSLVAVIVGDINGVIIAEKQPTKLAAMESLWETTTRAPVYLFALPDEENERNKIEIGAIPGMLSFLVRHDINAEIRGLKDFPKEERPPVLITSFAFKGMVGLGGYFVLMTIIGWFKRNRLVDSPKFLKLMLFSIPLPYVACELGWVVAEVGRQPWIVYGLMKTSDAVSPIAQSQVLTSLIAFILVYSLLGATGFYLIAKNSIKDPAL